MLLAVKTLNASEASFTGIGQTLRWGTGEISLFVLLAGYVTGSLGSKCELSVLYRNWTNTNKGGEISPAA